MQQIIECVPNFSEGINKEVITAIENNIAVVAGVKVLHIDQGIDANRTVITFAGEPKAVVEAAFIAIKTAGELIDMRQQKGAHPRMGATDVCPLIPVSNITLAEVDVYATQLAARVGNELQIPVYLYECSQPNKQRSDLAIIRSGEYEGFFEKMKLPGWQPDFGPAEMNARCGATVIGARDFLIAYNVNLKTTSAAIATNIAKDVRATGKMVKDSNGILRRMPGLLPGVKAIGWYMDQYACAQVSTNITDKALSPLHKVYDAIARQAKLHGTEVNGSELIGLIPLSDMLAAGRHYAETGVGHSEHELIQIAVKSLGLDVLSPFDPAKRILDYLLCN